MEVLAAIASVQSMYSLLKAIYNLQGKVVIHKEEVEKFTEFIRTIERHMQKQESILRQHQQGSQLLPKDVADQLLNLEHLLEKSRRLLTKLQSPLSYLVYRSSSLRELQHEINEIILHMVFEMVFAPTPQSDDSRTRGSQRPCAPVAPSFESNMPSYYPREHAGIGWQAYRDKIYPFHPPHDFDSCPRNRFHPLPEHTSPYPNQKHFQGWRIYKKQFPPISYSPQLR